MAEIRRLFTFKHDEQEAAQQLQQEYFDLNTDGDIELISYEHKLYPYLDTPDEHGFERILIGALIIIEYIIKIPF